MSTGYLILLVFEIPSVHIITIDTHQNVFSKVMQDLWLLPIYEFLFYVILKLSCDETPFGSLHLFRSGQSLNPYLPHCKTAFAFSEILYPLTYRLPLRFGFHSHGANWAYLVSYKYLSSDLGSTNRPATLHLCQKSC
jgi:hypothetical protein